jgi:hypothetical protein
VYNAAVDWLGRWVRKGEEPPHAPPLEFDEAAAAEVAGRGRGVAGSGEKPVKRDEFGNVRGGIRLPEMAVPVAKESAELCGLGGTHVPFEAATLNRLYPSHADYVSKVTAASESLVKAGFLLPADAAQEVDAAKRSIHGMQLTCGLLCSDVRQFPTHPSSTLLAKQTAFLMIKGGDSLVKLADEATRLIAQGYTRGPESGSERKFASAATVLEAYIDRVKVLRRQGNMPAETEALLAGQAATLRDLVRILAK